MDLEDEFQLEMSNFQGLLLIYQRRIIDFYGIIDSIHEIKILMAGISGHHCAKFWISW